jgi:hypothetical protein
VSADTCISRGLIAHPGIGCNARIFRTNKSSVP